MIGPTSYELLKEPSARWIIGYWVGLGTGADSLILPCQSRLTYAALAASKSQEIILSFAIRSA